MKTDVNRYEILGYFKYDCDLKKELTGFIEHIKKSIKFTEETQKSETYLGFDVKKGYLG